MRNIHRIIKVGNSLAVVLPRTLARELDIKRGDLVVLGCVQEGVVYVRKADTKDISQERVDVIDFN
jgi:antitoxin component of MazEF toxin-antitoxin module